MGVLRGTMPIVIGLLSGVTIGFFAVTSFLNYRTSSQEPVPQNALIKVPDNNAVSKARPKNAIEQIIKIEKPETVQDASLDTEKTDLVQDIIGPDLSQSQESVTAYAEQYGVSEVEAIHQLRREGPLSLVLDRIAQLEAGNVAAWGIERSHHFRGRIVLVRGSTLQPASQKIVNDNPDIDVFYDADYSLAELEQAYELLSFEGRGLKQYDLPADVQDAIAFAQIDMNANALTVSLYGSSGAWESDDAMVAETQGYLLPIVDVPLNFVVVNP